LRDQISEPVCERIIFLKGDAFFVAGGFAYDRFEGVLKVFYVVGVEFYGDVVEKFLAKKTPGNGDTSWEEFFPKSGGVRKEFVRDAKFEEDSFE